MSKEDIIKYANCWEDADLLLTSVPEFDNGNFLSIASGGDNSFALLTKNTKSLVMVDMNVVQLYLCELKMAAFKQLTYSETLKFIGIQDSKNRREVYESIKQVMTIAAQKYWDRNLENIELGVIYSGKFERYFQLFRTKVMPWIHSRKIIQKLLDSKSVAQQEVFYHDVWNSWRWRFLFRIFFSKPIMGRFGRTKEYLNQVEIPVGEFIFGQAEKHLISTAAQENYFLHFIFTGEFQPSLPPYLREENFEIIRDNLSKVTLVHGTAEEAFNQHEKFDFFNLSNIFEYMNRSQFENFERLIRPKINQGGVVSYWNLMVDRQFSSIDAQFYSPQNFDIIDKGFFYKRFVSEKNNLGQKGF